MKGKEEKTDIDAKPIEVKEVENPKEAASKEPAVEKTVEATSTIAEESSEATPPAEQSTDPTPETPEVSNDATTEQSGGNTEEEENTGDQNVAEETPEIKVFLIN